MTGWDQHSDSEGPIEVPRWMKIYLIALVLGVAAFGIWSLT